MDINNYKMLISSLPVRQQAFTTKRTTWKKAENEIVWLKLLNDKLFGEHQTLKISRKDIFDTIDLRETIIKTIYWGYTSGMRGNHFVNILTHIDLIEKVLEKLKQTNKPTTEDFNNEVVVTFKNVPGLGLSTYSKLLYFSKIYFNDNSCLILDQRLIDVFATRTFNEFQELSSIRYDNAERKYIDFLRLTNQISQNIDTKAENIEQFLFIFGNSLK